MQLWWMDCEAQLRGWGSESGHLPTCGLSPEVRGIGYLEHGGHISTLLSHTLVRSESAKARLSDDVVPVHRDVYPHCPEGSAILRAGTLEVGVLTIHERREIRTCEGVKIVRRSLGNPVSPEECVIEEQAALYGNTRFIKVLR